MDREINIFIDSQSKETPMGCLEFSISIIILIIFAIVIGVIRL